MTTWLSILISAQNYPIYISLSRQQKEKEPFPVKSIWSLLLTKSQCQETSNTDDKESCLQKQWASSSDLSSEEAEDFDSS